MAYITRRGPVYYLNLRLPEHLFPRCHTLRLSLKIRHRQSALFLASSLAQRVHSHLSEHPLTDLPTLRKLCTKWRDTYPAPNSMHRSHQPIAKPAESVANGPALSTLSKLYIEEGKRGQNCRGGYCSRVSHQEGIDSVSPTSVT